MPKVLGLILIGILVIAFISDYLVVNSVYENSGRGIEHAIDAGIVKAGYVTDAQSGFVQLNQASLDAAIRSEFIRNLKLDATMKNPVMKDTSMDISIDYTSSDVPWISVQFKTNVSFLLPFITYPVTINRSIAYESVYK
ncbi:hypothetical protein [Paenibacillus amylolyticus]|uniref:DUF4320 family protein n=1 Tax=Paenibacillus amylolyticus TaxID=1451 RepID=A0ABD8B337_PAEAM